MTEAALHLAVVVTGGSLPADVWTRTHREAGERGALVSLLVASGDSARWIVPPTPATAAPLTPQLPLAAVAWAVSPIVNKLAEAQAHVPSLDATEIVLVGGSSIDNALAWALRDESGILLRDFDAATNLLRLIKISANSINIVDVPAGGGEGIEYDAWDPTQTWPATLTWLEPSVMRIDVGPYRLEAKRSIDGLFMYDGTETGPWGPHEFTVLGAVTDESELIFSKWEMIVIDPWLEAVHSSTARIVRADGERNGFDAVFFAAPRPGALEGNGIVGKKINVSKLQRMTAGKVFLITFPTLENPGVPLKFDYEPDVRRTFPLVLDRARMCFAGDALWFRLRSTLDDLS